MRWRGWVCLPSGVLGGDQHRSFGVRGELVRDAARTALAVGPRPRWPQTIRQASISRATSLIVLATDSFAYAIWAEAL
jgi:hypothetical protein